MDEEQKQSESCSDSEFDIYADYDSGYGPNNSMSFDGSNAWGDPLKRKSKNLSQVVINKNAEAENKDMERLFKRPSLTVKISAVNTKKGSKAEDLRQFRNKMQSWFVHK